MEDKVRKDVAALFADNNYVSLDILDKMPEEHISLNILDKPIRTEKPREKCYLLSPTMECNVGGFAHLGCMDESFHSHCKFKLLHEKWSRQR